MQVSLPKGHRNTARTQPTKVDREFAFAPVSGFRSEKAAQIASYFVSKQGGKIEKMKLAKLMYLAEREHLNRFDRPMTMDEFYSLPHGPICTSSLNGIDGKFDSKEWERVKAHGRDRVHGKVVSRDDLDEVTNAELKVLETVWDKFGAMSANQVRAWTHASENCPEYVETQKSRLPITYEDVLRALGKENAREISVEIAEARRLHAACCD